MPFGSGCHWPIREMPTAQFNLGLMYHNGQGVPQDYREAVRWYRMAADQGDADAQFNLGVMYDNGRGVPQDYAEAVRWYRKAADQGYADAQFNLGVMYYNGRGRPAGLRRGHAGGIAWPPIRDMQTRSTTSASCTTTARACRRTTPRR